MRPQTTKSHPSSGTKSYWRANSQALQKQDQARQALKNAQLAASQRIVWPSNAGPARQPFFVAAANVMQGIGEVITQGKKGHSLVEGNNAHGTERFAAEGFSLTRLLFKNHKTEKAAGARQLNLACRALMAHPDAGIREAASELLGYIHLKETNITRELREAVKALNDAVQAACRANTFLPSQ